MSAWTKTQRTPGALWKRFGHGAAATGLTVFLLLFLVFARWLDAQRAPDQTIRMIELSPPVALPAPPPPPQRESEAQDDAPPPPPEVRLPHLELQLEAIAPPLAARLDPQIDLSMEESVFDVEIDPAPQPVRQVSRPPVVKTKAYSRTPAPRPQAAPAPAVRSTYDAGELDARPHLVNRPSATYPRSLQRAGVKEGKVLLEVSISTSGRVSVQRVISSTHDDFSAMARQFASRARFSVPKKDGKPVTAIYRWPLILRP